MNMYILYPAIATALVIIVLVGCTEILARMTRRIVRVRSMIEASRRCAQVCRFCTVIDYEAELSKDRQLIQTWRDSHPFGPCTMGETEELNELLLQLAGAKVLKAIELDQPLAVEKIFADIDDPD